ncbi:MAG: hypothetical protein ACR2NG_03545, partial [Acidimicrobiia bacterium]
MQNLHERIDLSGGKPRDVSRTLGLRQQRAVGFVCENGRTATDVVASREALMGNKNKESKGTKRAA